MAKRTVKKSNGVSSVEIAVHMLKTLAAFRRPVTLTEISKSLRVGPGKVHRYFVSLQKEGLLAKQPNTGRYELGPLSLSIGLSALEQIDAVRFASEALPGIRDELNLSITLSVWGDAGPVVVRIEESKDRVMTNVRVGTVLPVITSATGRVFMSYLPRNHVDEFIRAERRLNRQAESIAVDKIIEDVRRNGASRIDSVGLPGVSVLAVPILNHQGHPSAVLSVTSQTWADSLDIAGRTADCLRAHASEISDRLGYSLAKRAPP